MSEYCCDKMDEVVPEWSIYPPRKSLGEDNGWELWLSDGVQYYPTEERFPIVYCPFCGVKLEDEVKEGK